MAIAIEIQTEYFITVNVSFSAIEKKITIDKSNNFGLIIHFNEKIQAVILH